MAHTLANSLEEAILSLSPLMINENYLSALRKTASKLPPVVRTILECRLSADQPQVDLSQLFVADDREVLNTFLDSVSLEEQSWHAIRSFLKEWAVVGSPVEHALKGVWLEFDLLTGLEEQLTVPAIFPTINIHSFSSLSDPKLEKQLGHIFQALLGTERHREFLKACLNCLGQLPDGAGLNQIGFMLSRPLATLRLIVWGVENNQIEQYLRDIGMKSHPETLSSTIQIACRFFRSSVLSLDLSPELSPRIGFELFPKSYISESSFDDFIDYLVKAGLCSEEKRQALITWPRQLDPSNSIREWPDHLILQSLQKPTDFFSVMHRRINHFKLLCQPGQGIEAKVYLGFDHHWAKF